MSIRTFRGHPDLWVTCLISRGEHSPAAVGHMNPNNSRRPAICASRGCGTPISQSWLVRVAALSSSAGTLAGLPADLVSFHGHPKGNVRTQFHCKSTVIMPNDKNAVSTKPQGLFLSKQNSVVYRGHHVRGSDSGDGRHLRHTVGHMVRTVLVELQNTSNCHELHPGRWAGRLRFSTVDGLTNILPAPNLGALARGVGSRRAR